ncbi:Uncharacterised protein [Klebsiella variicola]|nr:Uncharacterised protein [Klebsiella variicola]SYE62215.1 Uncharacterised protein [Klebsiella pneumoniae]VUJ29273.1 Uncharacterised protein [Klebsiella pneumoniae]
MIFISKEKKIKRRLFLMDMLREYFISIFIVKNIMLFGLVVMTDKMFLKEVLKMHFVKY